MIYQKYTEVIKKRRAARLSNVDLAIVLHKPPSTVAGMLYGYVPMPPSDLKIILQTIEDAEKQQQLNRDIRSIQISGGAK